MLIVDASNLSRLIACNGSRLMQPDPVFAERDTTIREEGNAVHWLASSNFTPEEMIDRKAPNGIYITEEMAEHVRDYLSCIDRAPDLIGHKEWPYSLSGIDWQINGRADWIAFHGDNLNVDDFKYGYTIVEPERNWTMISHAIGYCVHNSVRPQQITFTIHQPRASHRDGRVRSWSIDYADLHHLYSQIVATLVEPSDTLQTGTHCYKCPAFLSCPARQNAELNAIEASEIAFNAAIPDAELAFRLDQIARAKSLLDQSEKAYKEAATHRISNGAIMENYAVENELTNRVWNDGVTPDVFAAITGRDISKRKLPTPRQAEQAGIDPAIIGLLSDRRYKGKKLVRVNSQKKAEKLFGKVK